MSIEIENFRNDFMAVTYEIEKVIVGSKDIIRNLLIAFFVGGHVLLEGVPGLGKTLLVKTLSNVLGFEFKRIQFTPDLMPADIVGTQMVLESDGGSREFRFVAGPIFANIVLADEINRATPKTQSALLEAMEEGQVTVAGNTSKLQDPFFVMATQNPIEMEGTYPIPEAQLDRFFFKLNVLSPDHEELKKILQRTTGNKKNEARMVFDPDIAGKRVQEMKTLVREVMISSAIEDFVVRIIIATHPEQNIYGPNHSEKEQNSGNVNKNSMASQFISYGASPRGGQAIILAAKVIALLDGRANVSYEDIRNVVIPALNHRIVLNFEADAENIKSEQIIETILKDIEKSN
ncbi:MAG: AAA family ATPase [Candidatus Anammoxibacter sp.]